jgi:uncharacterized NAD(P)/FAD-binding protein YdhS
MVDTILSLQSHGHKGSLLAVSRHGLLPRSHQAGGTWVSVLRGASSPLAWFRTVRAHMREASSRGIPWQRVFDALRPAAATIWAGWTVRQRSQFLRHLRTLWDIHRHRMPGRVADVMTRLVEDRRLSVKAGRIKNLAQTDSGIHVTIGLRHGGTVEMDVATVINCTGPQSDIRYSSQPLIRQILGRHLVKPDALGLGLESDDCAINADGSVPWLFALGALTRPAWWEITAVPEIRAQAERLARKIACKDAESDGLLSATFLDIGAGI